MANNKAKLIFSGERDHPDNKIIAARFYQGFAAYEFTKDFVKDKITLDAGCGEGYGTYYLSKYCKKIIGIDISREAIEYAKRTYYAENLEFQVMDLRKLEFQKSYFDAVISFAVIEHIKEYKVYISELCRVMKKDGICIISALNKITPISLDAYHYQEFTPEELKELLLNYFSLVNLYGISGISERIINYRKKRLQLINLLIKFKIFKIRKRIPDAIYRKLYVIGEYLLRTFLWIANKSSIEKISVKDFGISEGNLSEAWNILAVCRL